MTELKLPGEETTLRFKIGGVIAIIVALVTMYVTNVDSRMKTMGTDIKEAATCAADAKQSEAVLRAEVRERLKNIERDVGDIKTYVSGGRPIGSRKAS